MNKRIFWNKQKGKRVIYHTKNQSWNGRSGLVVGCLRGDQDYNNPYVYVMFDTKTDGTPTKGHVLWDCPANCLELVNTKGTKV